MLMVIVWHYMPSLVRAQPRSLLAYGMAMLGLTWAGMDLFFVLSGFLIGGILMDNRTAPSYFKAFYARRVCRIVPLYYSMLVVFAVGVAAGLGAKSGRFAWLFRDPLPMWTYVTYLQNFPMANRGEFGPNFTGITWSLAVEEQFYVVLPLMVRFVPPRALPWALAILVASAPLFRVVLLFFFPDGVAGYVLLPGRWDSLFLGALGAWAIRQASIRRSLCDRLNWIRLAVVITSLASVGLLVTGQEIGSRGMAAGGHTILALLSLGLLLLCILSKEGVVARLFRQPGLIWLGTVSYGVYLFHEPILGLVHGAFRNQTPRIAGWADAWATVLALGCTLGLAAASWQWFERPIVALGHRVSYGQRE